MEQKYYSAITKNEDTWKKSSSGGAFTEISNVWLEQDKAVVYGARIDENLDVKHVRVSSKQERDTLRGSKYIGSDASNIYKSVVDDLKNNNKVLFSGTPCQIAALNKIIEAREIDKKGNLLTVEVICHGVGSISFFKDYVRYHEKRYGSVAKAVSFRAKHSPTVKQDMQIVFENGKVFNSFSTKFDWFYSIYSVRNYLLRPSCYKCKYAKVDREADISLADLWELGKNEKAKSLVVINSDFGNEVWSKAKQNMVVEEKESSEIHQPHMHAPCNKPGDYDKFWEIYRQGGFMQVEAYAGNNTVKGKLVSTMAYLADALHLKNALKTLLRM